MWSYNDELYHWGIKGMRWGVRRYQNKDGTLTPAGKRRYADDPKARSAVEAAKKNVKKANADYAKATNEYNKKTLGGLVYNKQATQKLLDSSRKVGYAKEDLKDAKTKLKIPSKKSKRELALEQEYQNKGYSAEEAELAAYKRAKAEKVLKVVAAGALAAGVAYAGYRYYDRNIDKTLKVGTVLQNISVDGNKGVEDAFYAAYNPLDKLKYRGLYGGGQLAGMNPLAGMLGAGGDANELYDMSTTVKNNGLKVASIKSAKKALADMMQDKEFKAKMATAAGLSSRHDVEDLIDNFKPGDKVSNKVYDWFNTYRTAHDNINQDLSNQFYSKLKSIGYDAIQDINDKYSSGYNSVQPLIVFDGKNLVVNENKKLDMNSIAKDYKIATGLNIAEQTVKAFVPYGVAAVTAASGMKVISSKRESEIVAEYKKEHPGTKLSAKEIIRNYEG